MTDTMTQSESVVPPVADTEGARRATGVSATGGGARSPRIRSEVLEKAKRRTFSREFKQRILTEAEACEEPGSIGKLLRREGLYSSHLSKWRAEREHTSSAGLPKARGPKPQEMNPLVEENARLQTEIRQLKKRLSQAETIIDVQKKLSCLLGLENPSAETGRSL